MTNQEMVLRSIESLRQPTTLELHRFITSQGWAIRLQGLRMVLRHLATTGQIETKRIGRDNFHQIND